MPQNVVLKDPVSYTHLDVYKRQEQYEAVYCYVIVHNCKELEECTKLLEMTNSKALLRLIDRSIAEISQNI